VTEQIERELTELFHDRAERLDVLPPLPASRVRRARLHTALAMASVVAVLAAVGVVGVRLSSGSAGGEASIADAGSAKADLEQIAARMLSGRWRVTGAGHVVKNDSGGGTNSAGGPAPFSLQVDYDGQSKSAVAREDGNVVALQVGGVTYVPLNAPPEITRFLPKGARWQRMSRSMFGADPTSLVVGVGGSTVSDSAAPSFTSNPNAFQRGATVRRTSYGFRIDYDDSVTSSRTEVKLRGDGTIASMHSVGHTRFQFAPGAMTVDQTTVMDASFVPLAAPVQVSAPDPSTVVSDAQVQAAFQKSARNPGPNGKPCPQSITSPSPAVTVHRTTHGGSVTMTQSATVFGCQVLLDPVSPPPAMVVHASPSPSPR
jgi:hypothetical protein